VLEHAVEIDPNWADTRYFLGRAYSAIGKREEARREFAAAQKLSAEGRAKLEENVGKQKPRRKTKP
jgi:Flp pilus assembly protein TadD